MIPYYSGAKVIGYKRHWQVVWWWRWPTLGYWEYPRNWREEMSEPMFKGWYFGVFEIRYFPSMPIWS